MKPHAMGIETEYGYLNKENDDRITESVYASLNGVKQWLANGGRFYIDCGTHPEYATPECSNPVDLVAYDKAGEIIVQNKFKNSAIFKNGTAISIVQCTGFPKEVSFGCHENYQVNTRHYDRIINGIIPFLATRQIYAGAGKIRGDNFYLTQRGFHINDVITASATGHKPFIKEHGEHLTDPKKYKRLQIVCGDANMSEIATYLKAGTTALVLDLLEETDYRPLRLKNPVSAIRTVDADPSYRWLMRTDEGKTVSAIDVQREYMDAARKYVSKDEITRDVLARWEYALNALEKYAKNPDEYQGLDRWLDWAIKKKLLDTYGIKKSCGYVSPEAQEIDIRYHDINKDRGIYYALQRQGMIDRIVDDKDIEHAVDNPPKDTRAWFRGNLVKKMQGRIERLDWHQGRLLLGEWPRGRFTVREPLKSYERKLEKLIFS